MGRKERRELERKVKHLANTKPWEIQALVREQYSRELVESRLSDEVLAPGDKVRFNLLNIAKDPEFEKMNPEYRDFIFNHASDVFTLRKEARQDGPFGLVSFEEDDTDPRWMHYLGHLKKVKNDSE